ncbi:RNA-binding S4 domain-containing protein [Demequina iriomotensis]|uniref:RNA-binding S4 domain-containing protein n=1 Tax=Demequina iriomotensis TaxID=1536641 RepID=UPI0007855CFE|nr:RNA-binding S4 domain-containing protein [Demequina iriomotensis]
MTRQSPIADIPVSGDVIRLGQFLQLSGLVDTGGEAKEAIAYGEVSVNGEVDRRRGRQLQHGDVVELDGRRARVSA